MIIKILLDGKDLFSINLLNIRNFILFLMNLFFLLAVIKGFILTIKFNADLEDAPLTKKVIQIKNLSVFTIRF